MLREAVDALAMPGVCGVIGGEGQSEELIPTLIDLQRLGRFPFDRPVEYLDLEQVNDAMEASARGEVIKPVLRMPA